MVPEKGLDELSGKHGVHGYKTHWVPQLPGMMRFVYYLKIRSVDCFKPWGIFLPTKK